MRIGSHLSIGGGLHNALLAAGRLGFGTVGMFVRNQVQWRVPPLGEDAVREFRRVRRRLGIGPVVAHGSYLVNLAGEDPVRGKSVEAVLADLDRCGRLGIEDLVLHPGSNADAEEGIRRIADGLNAVFDRLEARRPKVLLETTAGSGATIGHTFEQLAAVLAQVRRTRRVGVCLDTCHSFAAGMPIHTPAGWRRTLARFDERIGLDRLLAIHLNDSKRPRGSRVDRHEHIGRGKIGRRGFRHIVNDPRLADLPAILETPKGTDDETGRDWDAINAQVVRSLVRG